MAKNYINEQNDLQAADMVRNVTETSPEEAVLTIERANTLGMHPDNYDEMKMELEPEVKISERVPAEVDPSVKNVMSSSSKMTEAIQPEIGVMDTIAKQAKFMWYNLYEKRELENEILDLEEKNMAGQLSEEEVTYLDGLYDIRQEELESFRLDTVEQIPGQVAGVIGDMVESVEKNKEFIALTTGGAALAGSIAPGVGTIGAGATALGLSIPVALGMEQYRKMKLGTYGELRRARDEETGQPLNLPKDKLENISIGVGLIGGGLEAATGGVLTAGLRKLLIPKQAVARVVKNASLRAAVDTLGNTTKVAIANAGEEVSSEIVSLVAENYAQGHNSEEGLINAIYKTANDIQNDPEVRKRLGITAVVGGLAGGTIATGTAIPLLPKIRQNYVEKGEFVQATTKTLDESLKSIQNQNETLKLASMVEETKLNNMSPNLMTEVTGQMFEDAGYSDRIWISKIDMDIILENNPELAAQLESLNVTEANSEQTYSPIGIVPHQFYDLVKEVPSVTEYARLHPDAPNPLESRNFLERFKEADEQRQQLIQELGEAEVLTPEQQARFDSLDQTIEEGIRNSGEQGYLERPTFTEAIEGVIPDKQVESFNKAQMEARQNVAKQIRDEFERRELRAENRLVKERMKIENEQEIERLNKDLQVVESYRPTKGEDVQVQSHKRKGFSKYAIDPQHLPEDLREVYLTDPKLKKRKVFVEGGVTPNEAAGLLGVENGQELLRILSTTPTKQEMVQGRKNRAAEIRELTREQQAIDADARRNLTFDKMTNAHLKEMKFMREQKWPATKQGVKNIALPLPKIPEIQLTAKKVIANTKVGELNIRQFNAGEKASQRMAVNHILNNEVERAYTAKEKAILNTELTREALRVRSEINKGKAVIKRVTSKKGLKLFQKTGALKELNDILTVFDLQDKVTKKKKTEQEAFLDYVKQLDEQGDSVEIPESLSDIRQRGSDMTTQEFIRVADRIKTLEKQAKMENKLFKQIEQQEKANKIQTEEAIVEDAVLDLQDHQSYQPSRLKDIRNRNSKTDTQKRSEGFNLFSAMLTNYKNVVTQLDRDLLQGKHYGNLVDPMVKAENFKRSKNFQLVNQIKTIMKDYGDKEFIQAFHDFIEIPEFEGFADLGNGTMNRADLWTLFAYLGDPQGRERVPNFVNPDTQQRMDVETIRNVLERVLTDKDAKLAQNFVNIYKSFEQESKDLHFRTTGVEPNMIKGVPIEFKGKVYDGGYVPNNYLNTSPQEKANRFLESLGKKEMTMFGGKDEGKLYAALRASEQTEQGRLIDRVGSSRPLDTDFMNFLHSYEETIHDLAYREAGSDTLKLLRNPLYSEAIIATVGLSKYQTLINGVIETVGNVEEGDTLSPFNKEISAAKRWARYLEQGFNIAALGFNIKSIFMQPLSFGAATLRMGGPSGAKYIAKSAGHILSNLHNYKEIFARAAEINPDLIFNQDSIDDTLVKSTFDFIPKVRRSKFASSQKLSALRRGHKHLVDISMLGLTKMDVHIKAATTMAAYAQFLDGNAPGTPMSKLDKMTDTQKDIAAKKYAKQVADLALTTSAVIDKTAVEKISMLRIFTRFYTDRRAQLNTAIAEGRKIKFATKEAVKAISEGDGFKARHNAKIAGTHFASFMAVYGLMQMYQDSLYDDETPLKEAANVRSMNDFKNFMTNTTNYVLKAPVRGIMQSSPIGGDIQFALESRRANKRFGLPITQTFTDVTMAITGLADLLEGNELSKKQKKSLLFTASFAVGGIPVNGPQKIMRWFDENETVEGASGFIKRETRRLGRAIDKYIKDNPNETEIIKQLEDVKKEVISPDNQETQTIIPEDAMEALKTAEWDDLDPDTGGAGIYQFTQERWDEISDQNPELALTEDGRVSKNTEEQERAMKWSMEENAKGLLAYQLPVSNVTLYGAHRFGLDDYVVIALSKDNTKVKNIVSNPDLFKGFKTVRQVKNFINRQVKNK